MITSSLRALCTFYKVMIPKFILLALTSAPEIQTHMSNHLLNSFTCMRNRYLKMNMAKTELLISSLGTSPPTPQPTYSYKDLPFLYASLCQLLLLTCILLLFRSIDLGLSLLSLLYFASSPSPQQMLLSSPSK